MFEARGKITKDVCCRLAAKGLRRLRLPAPGSNIRQQQNIIHLQNEPQATYGKITMKTSSAIRSGHPTMSNLNSSKKPESIQNKALYSRISYLHQAATYLATRQLRAADTANPQGERQMNTASSSSDKAHQAIARRLVSDLRSVGQKSVIRMAPEIKRSICKYCDAVLIDGSTCTSEIENKSNGGKKPWADVLVRKCNSCGFAKRFPMSSKQKRRPHRVAKVKADTQSMQLG